MENETKVVEQPHSCKIAINGKGQWSGEVKVYADTPAKAVDEAFNQATELKIHLDSENGKGSP